ncbi:MAG: tetratricopeptide repeat protein, partial [Phycisphaerae bacterium]|nr:tetratricopeptide repeat protein [Phycisphaerae bacterium]
DPNVAEIQMLLAEVYQWKEDFEAAISSYKRAIELDSNNPEALTFLALAYIRTNYYEPAIELLTLAVQAQPDDAKAYKYLGYCHLKLNAVDEAIEAYQTAARINENDWETLRSLGVAFMLKAIVAGDEDLKQEAIRQWRASLEIEPDQPDSQTLLKLAEKYSGAE